MLRSFPVTLAVMLVSGCSTLPQVKRSASSEEKDAKTSAATISQLGVALPAMKPGDERKLKIIAADQMSGQGYWNEAIELYREAEAMAPKKPKLDAQLAQRLPAQAADTRIAATIPSTHRRRSEERLQLINNYAVHVNGIRRPRYGRIRVSTHSLARSTARKCGSESGIAPGEATTLRRSVRDSNTSNRRCCGASQSRCDSSRPRRRNNRTPTVYACGFL